MDKLVIQIINYMLKYKLFSKNNNNVKILQLGMMVIAVGLSSYNLALFHLVNHAFYKGLLFLGAGAVIHAWADNQDFRKYGGLRPFLPLTYSVMLIASLSLVAFPFMTGFYSKDFILESAYGQFYFSSTVVYFIAIVGAMFTTLYSVKVLYLTFLTNPNGPLINYKQVHEGDIFMSLPLIILAIFSIFFGYLTKDIFIGLGSNFFADNSLFIHPTHEIMLDTEFAVPSIFKLLPLVFTISLTAVSLVLPEFFSSILISFKFSRVGYNIFGFLNQRFLIELFYNKYITGIIFKLGGQTTKVLDKGSVELVGPFGLEKVLVSLSRNISSLDTGVITSYALYILIGLIFYILMPYIWLTNSSLLLLIMFSLSITINLDKNKISNNTNITNGHTFVSLPLQSQTNLNFGLFDSSYTELYNCLTSCILFMYNCLDYPFIIGMVSVPVILILASKISDLLNPMDNEAKQGQKLDLTKKILGKDEPNRHHVDIAFTCDLYERRRPKWYLYDKNDDSCLRLKEVYPAQTFVLQGQIINGILRQCLKVPNNTLQQECSNAPLVGLWVNRPTIYNAQTAGFIITTRNLPLTYSRDNTKVLVKP